MILCGDDCIPICDFCLYLNRKGYEHKGESLCRLHNKIVDWGQDGCDDFHCGNCPPKGGHALSLEYRDGKYVFVDYWNGDNSLPYAPINHKFMRYSYENRSGKEDSINSH
jgi:hypothetical protein